MPKNYDKMIADATHRIANYYQTKLIQNAGKYSADMCEQMYKDAKEMHDSANDVNWYINYGWYKITMQVYSLDRDVCNKVARPFFNAAREYMVHKQGKFGVYDTDEQKVDTAIEKLYAKIGEKNQTLEENSKQRPIDYVATISDTVEKLTKFYEIKLEKIKDKISEEKYKEFIKELDTLRVGANIESEQYYLGANYGWMSAVGLMNLDYNMRQVAEKFFNAVKQYVNSKAQGLDVSKSEQEIMRSVKVINLKIGGEMFIGLKDLFLSESHFMTRCDLSECVARLNKKR
ncbi:MAG: hypothetical protein J6Y07_00390 [Alphaproteobacteria bacterium]|nr:hypothetical protein [Alphaproteobacteria bacterium]